MKKVNLFNFDNSLFLCYILNTSFSFVEKQILTQEKLMSHTTFEWAVVRCMDGRLNKYISDYLKSQGVPEIHDTIAIPGGPKDLADEESLTSLAVKNVSISLHGIKKIMLIQHTDCGAYGGRNDCGGNEEADFNLQKGELVKSVHAIEKRHPELEIHAVVAHIHDSGEIAFHKI